MVLLMIMTSDEYQEIFMNVFNELNISATMVASTGQFLQYGESTFIVGMQQKEVDGLMKKLNESLKLEQLEEEGRIQFKMQKIKKTVATVMMIPLHHFERV